MGEQATEYDVIIVGGRPAGSSLAARLGRAGLRVLLLERAQFPSEHPASSPIIYASAMQLLDEIGADETAYARNTPPIYRIVQTTRHTYGEFPLPYVGARNYAYAVDRARFDAALWETAVNTPNVEGRQGFNVTDLLRTGEAVCGVVGKGQDGVEQTITAKLVVGADGRFSFLARKMNAAEHDVHNEITSTVYYAYWRGVQPYDDLPKDGAGSAVGYKIPGLQGVLLLVMDSADQQTVIVLEAKPELFEGDDEKTVEERYRQLLEQQPKLAARMKNAQMVTKLHGMRRIGNLYRQAGGEGWALTGDAYHHKDPIDGQGIYDALLTAKVLSEAIIRWHRGELSWAQALAQYDANARAQTYPTYQTTLKRLKFTMTSQTPTILSKTVLRWLVADPRYARRAGMLLSRQVTPEAAFPKWLIIAAIARGITADIGTLLRGKNPFDLEANRQNQKRAGATAHSPRNT